MKDMLKRDKWWFWLILLLVGETGIFSIVLALTLGDVFSKDAWYAKWYYWLIGVLCCFFPAVIMFAVFEFQILTIVSKKLEVPGSEIYACPYTWMICLIVPILGWVILATMILYLNIFAIVALYRGKGEKFIEN